MNASPEVAAPGCYGSALTYSADGPECRSCMFAATCKPLSLERRTALRAKLGIPDRAPVPAKVRTQPASDGASLMSTLPKKVGEAVQRIERMGVKVTEALRQGVNPFTTKPAFLRLTCHLLLRMPDGFDRQSLKHGLMRKLDWSEGTASSHAAQAFQILVALGAAEEINGKLTMKRN